MVRQLFRASAKYAFAVLALMVPSFAQAPAQVVAPKPVSAPADNLSSATDSSADAFRSPVEYLAKPPSTHPLQGLLPAGGIAQHPSWGYLKFPDRNILNQHEIDFESREVRIHSLYYNTLSRDTANLWTAYYQELASYTFDMYDIGLQRLWLNSLIGQKDAGSEAQAGSLFDISIPVNMPAWMKDLGLDKPKLQLQGQMTVRLHGFGKYDDAPGATEKSLWPAPSLSYEPSFLVKGKIGRNITVEVNNTESGLGVRNQIKVVYAEATPGEFEDQILQRVELGSTSLSLKGTQLTGYSENHQGLFGLKSEFKIGDWWLTTIASQDGGSSEKYTMRANSEDAEFEVADKSFLPYRYYFLNHAMRDNYITMAIQERSTLTNAPTGLALYKQYPLNSTAVKLDSMTAVYKDPSGNITKKTGLLLTLMDEGKDWVWDSRTGTVKVLTASKNSQILASWANDGTGRSNTNVRRNESVVMIQYGKNSSDYPDMDKLMLRNVYSIGISESNSTGFLLNLKSNNGVATNKLITLGLVDSAKGTVLVNDPTIFTKTGGKYTGEMWLPCRPTRWYKVSDPTKIATQNCLEPLRNADTSSGSNIGGLYTTSITDLNRYTSIFSFQTKGKRRSSSISVRDASSSFSVSSGNCVDIAPNSESLKIGSATLQRDVDYSVNYELGQIELISDRALDPNSEITVNYECEPLFSIDNKVLLGLRAEYPIRALSDKSIFGLTALYKNQSSTQTQPRFGGEPFSSTLLGANLTLQDSARWMDHVINALPFIDTKARSQWTAEAEIASAYHNANTSSNKSALLDDFESSGQSLQYSTTRTYWTQASPPGGSVADRTTYNENLDYRHLGEFVWHSNQDERYRNIYPAVGNSDVDSRQMPILKFTLRPNDNLEGKSWGGVMRANGSFYSALDKYRYIEVVARGNVGNLYFDLGSMSEDISINGAAPDGILESEAALGTSKQLNDCGLDGVCDGGQETFTKWDCRTPECEATVTTSLNSSNPDIAKDDFDEQTDDTDPTSRINGTEKNNGDQDYSFDSEDLDKNGTLDEDVKFVRYRINLESTNGAEYEVLKNGWRRWRIPLSQFDTIVSANGGTWSSILSNATMTRLWYGNLKRGVVEGQVQIVDMKVVGNQWEETQGANQFGFVTDGPTQIVTVDGNTSTITAPGQVLLADSNFLKLSMITNREDANRYFKSPNTVTERDASTNAALKEQSLVLDFGSLHPGQEVSATRAFDTDKKDLTQYKDLKLEIHLDGKDQDSVPVRFAVQIGYGGLLGSDNYYEWSFKPEASNCKSDVTCHNKNWVDNAMDIPLATLVRLKDGRVAPFLNADSLSLDGTRSERVKIVGNPSLGNINYVRFVIIADDEATANSAKGTFWVNDLRLSGMSNTWGYAGRLRGQLDFADVMSVSGETNYKDGNFATLKSEGHSPKPTLAEANTELINKGDLHFNVNKFFKDEWGFHMPLSLSYSSTVRRPYLKPSSDVGLTHDQLSGLASEALSNNLELKDTTQERILRETEQSKGYQSFTRGRGFSFGYSKEHTKDKNLATELLTQALLERPAFNYNYRETEGRSSLLADSTYSYGTTIDYRLGTYEPFAFRPLKNVQALTIEPWPQTLDLTLWDLNYTKSMNEQRDPELLEPASKKITDYTVMLQHKLNMRWNILPFLSATYTIAVKRDMENGGDRAAFSKDQFFDASSKEGLFAKNAVFDYDHTDRRIFTSLDSVVISKNSSKRKSKLAINKDTIPLIESDTSTFIEGYDTTAYMKIDSVGNRDFGRAYGILRNERSRNQDFKVNFTPAVIPFLLTRFAFGSTFQQDKTLPDNFRLDSISMLTKNFWSIQSTNRFEFTPTVRLVDLLGWGSKNAATAFLDKWKWREIRGSWTVDLKTTGEDFTFAQLHDQQGVSPFQYYLWGLGFGTGFHARNPLDFVTGDMTQTQRSDYENFAEYRSKTVDTIVYTQAFQHAVQRRATMGTNFTLPIWETAITVDGQWSEEFKQPRSTPLFLDTTTVWPKVGVGVSIPNLASHFAFLRSYLKTLGASHRTDYTFTTSVTPFQSSEDEWRTEWAFAPLLRLSALTNKDIRIDNDVNFSYGYSLRRPKVQVVTSPSFPSINSTLADTTEYFYSTPWMYTDTNQAWTYTWGDELSIGYDLKTKRGFQMFKWYWRLKNDINLKLNLGYSYEMTKNRAVFSDPNYTPMGSDMSAVAAEAYQLVDGTPVYYPSFIAPEPAQRPTNTWTAYIRPNAGYQINKMASMASFIEYRYTRATLSEGGAHSVQILQFEISLMLKFD